MYNPQALSTLEQSGFRCSVTHWLAITAPSTVIASSTLKREVCLKYFLIYERLITGNV